MTCIDMLAIGIDALRGACGIGDLGPGACGIGDLGSGVRGIGDLDARLLGADVLDPGVLGSGGTAVIGPLTVAGIAFLAAGGPGGSPRLRAITAADPTASSASGDPSPSADVPPPVLRGRWTLVAACAAALVSWLLAGGPHGGGGAVVAGGLGGIGLGVAIRLAVPRLTGSGRVRADPGGVAAGWELLATCLDAGLPVSTAVDAAARRTPEPVAAVLRRVAGALALGSPADEAWRPAERVVELAAFGRAARRAADTGAGLARVARAEATRLRAALADTSEARAERAAVLIAAPLGLCFLPAFLALGIAPVVIGLAGEALTRW